MCGGEGGGGERSLNKVIDMQQRAAVAGLGQGREAIAADGFEHSGEVALIAGAIDHAGAQHCGVCERGAEDKGFGGAFSLAVRGIGRKIVCLGKGLQGLLRKKAGFVAGVGGGLDGGCEDKARDIGLEATLEQALGAVADNGEIRSGFGARFGDSVGLSCEMENAIKALKSSGGRQGVL